MRQHFMPEQGGEQETRRAAFALADALVGVGQRQHHEFFAHRLLENDVKQGQQAMVQTFVAQLGNALHGKCDAEHSRGVDCGKLIHEALGWRLRQKQLSDQRGSCSPGYHLP